MTRLSAFLALIFLALTPYCIRAESIQCIPSYVKLGAACSATGTANQKAWFLRSNVLVGDRLYVGGVVRWNASGRIDEVGCADESVDGRVMDCPGSVVAPGLINLHEHLNFGADDPLPPPLHPFTSHSEWQSDSSAWGGKDAPWTLNRQLIGLVELRHLLSGTTTIAGRARTTGLTRNPDAGWIPKVANVTFPFGKHVVHPPSNCREKRILSGRKPTLVHAGEGVDDEARSEITCLLDNREAFAQVEPLTVVHGIPVDKGIADRMAALNVSMLWSPRSNMVLYGATAPVSMLLSAGVPISLGTDWVLSGSPTLLDEARYARELPLPEGILSDDRLMDMMTTNPAAAIGMSDEVGQLKAGAYADIVGYSIHDIDHIKRDILLSQSRDVSFVIVGGKLKFVSEKAADLLDRFVPKKDCVAIPASDCGVHGYACGSTILDRALRRPDASDVLCPSASVGFPLNPS